MLFPISSLMAVCFWGGHVLPDCCAKYCCADSGKDAPAMVICLSGEEAQPRVAVYGAGSKGTSCSPLVLVSRGAGLEDDEDQLIHKEAPSHWIGVLLTPVPAPLAAHVGSDGLMIVNVVKDSPADQAGLERYDIVVAFDGQKTDSTEDLLDAIADVGIGTKADIVIIRGGQKQTLKLAPAKRPDKAEWQYKYDQPEEEVIDESLKLRGQWLRKGPGGHWILEELGPMQTIPDVLKDVYKLRLDDFGAGIDLDDLEDIDVRIGVEPYTWRMWDEDEEDEEVRVEVQVQVDDDGNVTTIRRDADGKIHVKRVDPDGEESSATFENAEEFKDEDPEGYKLYRRHSSGPGRHSFMYRTWPRGQFGKARKSFQVEVEKKLREALKRSEEAQAQAEAATKKIRKQIRKMLKEEVAPDEGAPAAKKLTVKVDEDGKITVTTVEGQEHTIYEFDDKEEFRQSEPELYEKVKSLFE